MQETQVWSLGQKIPWRRKWQPTPVFLPGKSYGQRSLTGYSPWGCKRVRYDLVTKQQHCYYYYCMNWCLERCSINLWTMVISTWFQVTSTLLFLFSIIWNFLVNMQYFLKNLKLFFKKIHMKYSRRCSLEGCSSACNNFSSDQTA